MDGLFTRIRASPGRGPFRLAARVPRAWRDEALDEASRLAIGRANNQGRKSEACRKVPRAPERVLERPR